MRVIIFSLLLLSSLPAYGHTVKDLLENFNEYHGQTVEITVEVIGEAIQAQGGYWINVVDQEGFNIGVFIKNKELLKKITYFGNYKFFGDQVKIIGQYHRKCQDHIDRDIHAEYISVIKPGGPRPEQVPAQKKQFVIILAGICLLLAVVHSVKSYYGRKNNKN